MPVSNLPRIELGSQGPPADEIIERISIALKADPSELLRATADNGTCATRLPARAILIA